LLGCIGKVKGKTIALIRHPAALEEDCRTADIVIAPFSVGKGCQAARVVVDRRALQADGAYALYIEAVDPERERRRDARAKTWCLSVPWRNRLYPPARPTLRSKARPTMTTRTMMPGLRSIPTSEGVPGLMVRDASFGRSSP
jgi:competence protein ComEC